MPEQEGFDRGRSAIVPKVGITCGMSKGAPEVRYAEVDRESKLCRVQVVLDLDGGQRRDIQTGLAFFDRLIHLMAYHGRFNLGLILEADLRMGDFHALEAAGATLGQAISQALTESDSVVGAASLHMPCGDALVLVALDLGASSNLTWHVPLVGPMVGDVCAQSLRGFFQGLAAQAPMSLHIRVESGSSDVAICEAIFKGLGHVLGMATTRLERRPGHPGKGTGR